MSKDAPAADRRAAVAEVILDRMRDRELSVPEIMKRSKLSENTVRDMAYGTKAHNESSWVAMSLALDFMPDYLLKILNGETDANVPGESPMERRLAEMAIQLSEIGALRKDVDVLKDVVYRIDKKIDIIIDTQRASDGGAESD